MNISALGEFGLIRHIQKRFSRKAPSTLIGIGDDAAALRLSPASILLATTDMLLEDVHFDLSLTDFYSLGWKSGAVNVEICAGDGRRSAVLSRLARHSCLYRGGTDHGILQGFPCAHRRP